MTAVKTISTYLSRSLRLPLCVQASRACLCERTLRRWVRSLTAPSSDLFARYLSWVLGAACDPLRHDTADSPCASILRGYRLYWSVVGGPRDWAWLLLVLDGKELWRCSSGHSSASSLDVLRLELLSLVAFWLVELPAFFVDGGDDARAS